MSLDLRMKFSLDTAAVTQGLKTVSTAFKSAMGAFAVTQVASLVQGVAAYAGQLKDLSEQTGFSTDALQEWNYAATQSGLGIENMQSAMQRFQDMMGDTAPAKEQEEALDKLGLSFRVLKTMSPEDAFKATAQAVAQIPDQMERTNIAVSLFGKSGMKVAAVAAEFDKLAKDAPKASKEAIAAAAAFDDQIDKMRLTVKGWGVEAINAISEVGAAWGRAFGGNEFDIEAMTEPMRQNDSRAALEAEAQAQKVAEQEFAQREARQQDAAEKRQKAEKKAAEDAKKNNDAVMKAVERRRKADEDAGEEAVRQWRERIRAEAQAKNALLAARKRLADAEEEQRNDAQRDALQKAVQNADEQVAIAEKAVDEIRDLAQNFGARQGFAAALERQKESPAARRRRERQERADAEMAGKIERGERLTRRERKRLEQMAAKEDAAAANLRGMQGAQRAALQAVKEFDAAGAAKAQLTELQDANRALQRAQADIALMAQNLRVRD